MLLLSKMSFEECRKNGITVLILILIGKIRENRISLPRWKKKKKVEVQLVCSFSNEISFSFSFFNKQLPFILTHSISSNQTKAKAKSNQDEKRKKQRKWTSSTTIEQIENPIRLTRAWREYEQTTLTQLPAFTALCKCNEHTITSNAHSYPSHHFNADRDLSHWCFRRLKPIQQSNEWVWRTWQEKYPTRWEMTIHYTANDYSLFNTKQ